MGNNAVNLSKKELDAIEEVWESMKDLAEKAEVIASATVKKSE